MICNVLLVRPAGFEGFFADAKSQVLTSSQQCPASRFSVNDFLVRRAGFEGFFAGAKSQVLTSPQQCPASYCVFHAMYFWYARQGSKASLLTQSRRFSPRFDNVWHHTAFSIQCTLGTPGRVRTCDPLVRSQVL